MTQPAVTTAIRRRLQFGFTVEAVVREFGVAVEVVREEKRKIVLERRRSNKRLRKSSTADREAARLRKNAAERRRYLINSMKRDGYTAEQIAAVFGE